MSVFDIGGLIMRVLFLLFVFSVIMFSCGKENDHEDVWSDISKEGMSHAEAVKYCDNLDQDGVSWRLPSISELRTLIQNCPDTVTDGKCSISDDCLEYACFDSCSCNYVEFPDYSKLGDTECLWSSSAISDKGGYYWSICFDNASFDPYINFPEDFLLNKVRCIQSK